LFVDEGNSMVTGREVYGFNKQMAEFIRPPDIQSPKFSMDVLGVKHFSAEAVAQTERLLELHAADREPSKTVWREWNSVRDFFVEAMAVNIRPEFSSSLMNFSSWVLTRGIPLVFLKQMRSAADPRKASFQQVLEAPLQIRNFYGGAPLTQPYQLTISELNSHPLVQKLGLESVQSTSLRAWLKVDFILGLGTES